MNPCPHCGEKIRKEARICRHCHRGVSFRALIETPLNDRQIYEFAKLWVEIEKNGFEAESFSNLQEAKSKLTRPPFELARGLSLQDKDNLIKKLGDLPVSFALEKPKSHLEIENEKTGISLSGIAYASLAFSCFGVLGFWLINGNPFEKKEIASTEYSRGGFEIPTQNTLPTINQKQQRDSSHLSREERLGRAEMQRLLDATVFIQDAGVVGSGFFISNNGHILSNAHVTSKMKHPSVLLRNGTRLEARKIKEDLGLDIALLQISTHTPQYLPMGDANDLYPGEDVITIGNPSGLSFTVTRGIVSYVGREINGVKYIQTDAAINPGNSGGPMISSRFEVVGINTLTAKVEKGISFALPINYAYSPGGVAEGLGDHPSSASSFQGTVDPAKQSSNAAKQDQGISNSESYPANLYENEARKLNEEFLKNKKEIEEKIADYQKGKSEIAEKMKKNQHDLSMTARLQKKLDEIQRKMDAAPEEYKKYQLRYIDQMISLYQRQKGDSRYQTYADKIDQEIQNLRTERIQIADSE